MLIYIVDDRGIHGEYAGFLQGHRETLPSFTLEVFSHWQALYDAVCHQMPSVIIADMRFDEIPIEQLYGDIDGLCERFCGNRERAEAQIRGMQGLLICRALREHKVRVPILLFASLAQNVKTQVEKTLAPIRIIEGLILQDVRNALREVVVFLPS